MLLTFTLSQSLIHPTRTTWCENKFFWKIIVKQVFFKCLTNCQQAIVVSLAESNSAITEDSIVKHFLKVCSCQISEYLLSHTHVKNVFWRGTFSEMPIFEDKKALFPQTCLMPWKAQSQKSSSAQRNDAWNTESNILGTQLFTRKLSGNSGSVEQKTLKIPIPTSPIPFTASVTTFN